MAISNLKDLYVHELDDLYSAECQIIDALPQMVDASYDPVLKRAFQKHLEVTREQKRRLEKIFSQLQVQPGNVTCEGMEGIIKEGQMFIKKDKSFFREDIDKDVLNAALIGSAQRVEHYEISAYGTARSWANLLGFSEQAALLQQTLEEEVETDRELSGIAETSINALAA